MYLPKKASWRMSAAAILRAAYPRSTYKRVAYDFGVSINAVKLWMRDGFPKAREEQLRTLLEARLEEQAQDIASHLQMVRREIGTPIAPTRLSRCAVGASVEPTIEVARTKGPQR